MGVTDELKKLMIMGLMVALIGGVASFVLGMVISPIVATTWGGMIAILLAIVLLLLLKIRTDVETFDIFSFVILLLAVAFVGGIITTVLPAAAAFILVPTAAFTPQGLGWTFVYIGIAMLIAKSRFDG